MHGLPIGKLVLAEYDDSWPQIFQVEARAILVAVERFANDIQHIGSTAVPGLLAKPIIDIGLAVASEHSVQQLVTPLTDMGYEFRGLNEEPERYYFIKNQGGLRLFHLHVLVEPHKEWEKYLRFRDNLRRFPDLAQKYAAKKLEWAEAADWNKAQYSLSKDDFVAEVLARGASER